MQIHAFLFNLMKFANCKKTIQNAIRYFNKIYLHKDENKCGSLLNAAESHEQFDKLTIIFTNSIERTNLARLYFFQT